MSTSQRMTLIGLYNYEQTFERDLFSTLELPEEYDKPTFVNSLLMEHGEKCVLYTNPEFFKQAINVWSKKWALELSRIYEALTAEYNPIWNYDRYENVSDGEGVKYESTTNAGHKAKDTPKYDVKTEQKVNGSDEHQISADNSSDYQPETKDIHDGGTINVNTNGATQDLTESSNSKTNDQTSRNYSHDGHMWGNIGVTTSASMVTEIVQQRVKYNLYDIACKLFASELLIGIF